MWCVAVARISATLWVIATETVRASCIIFSLQTNNSDKFWQLPAFINIFSRLCLTCNSHVIIFSPEPCTSRTGLKRFFMNLNSFKTCFPELRTSSALMKGERKRKKWLHKKNSNAVSCKTQLKIIVIYFFALFVFDSLCCVLQWTVETQLSCVRTAPSACSDTMNATGYTTALTAPMNTKTATVQVTSPLVAYMNRISEKLEKLSSCPKHSLYPAFFRKKIRFFCSNAPMRILKPQPIKQVNDQVSTIPKKRYRWADCGNK